jgi:hypothetical protein
MGADSFTVVSIGKTAKAAFSAAVEQARYENGNDGYSGTIAEKSSFVMITVPENVAPHDYVDQLFDADDDRISDKRGPAGCINLGNDKWGFFGYASS